MRFLLLLVLPAMLCCRRIHTTRPECQSVYAEIPQDTSYLSTPLVIPTQLIEDKLNHVIRKDFFNDDDFDNKNKKGKRDKTKLKISRLGDIKVEWHNNVATYQAPLQVLIEKELVSDKVLPIGRNIAVKTEFSLLLVFETALEIGTDWRLAPQTKFKSYKWLSEVKAFGGLIDIKKGVERKIDRQMPLVVIQMDSLMHHTIHLDKTINKVWQDIQKPIRINKNETLIWLKIHPIGFELGAITTRDGNLMVQGRLSATTETVLGENPTYTVDSILPPLVRRAALPNSAYVYMLSALPYKDINEIISRKVAGQSMQISGHTLNINEAEIWGCGSNLVLHLKVSGGAKGEIYLQGTPQYEPDSQRIVISNFDFEVRTEEALLANADWLLHSTFKDQMQEALSLPLGDKIAKIPQSIMEGIENGKLAGKMGFVIEQWDFKPQKIWIRPDDLVALVIVNATVRVELEKL